MLQLFGVGLYRGLMKHSVKSRLCVVISELVGLTNTAQRLADDSFGSLRHYTTSSVHHGE